MEKKTDLRITKTYMALTNAFFQMMEEKRFEDIKVSELCDRAMIRKSTFYKHFADKYEFLAFIVSGIQKRFDHEVAMNVTGGNPVDYYRQLISRILDYLEVNRKFVQSTMSGNSFAMIVNVLSEQIKLDICRRLREEVNAGYNMPASPEVMAPFFIGAIMGTIQDWLSKGKSIAEASLKKQLCSIVESVYNASNSGSK